MALVVEMDEVNMNTGPRKERTQWPCSAASVWHSGRTAKNETKTKAEAKVVVGAMVVGLGAPGADASRKV